MLPANEPKAVIRRMQRAKRFMVNTCPASRHVALIAKALVRDGGYDWMNEEPGHCAGSLAATVHALWVARSKLKSLGYEWTVDERGQIRWRKARR